MMSWEAANAPKARREKRLQDDLATTGPSKKRRATETVESVLARLSKAYTSSMECIGALNKTNQILLKETTVSDDSLAALERVSNAARKTLENGILLDPLVLTHVPTLNQTMQNLSLEEESSSRWEAVKEKRAVPPVLSSAAHKSTIRELAYLALVNYADLLLSCCVCDDPSCQDGTTILDRGVVKKVQVLADKKKCCWKGEPKEDTQRLAVTALCDASNLDGTDPTLWLKLACASRGLENIVLKEDDPTTLITKYRRMQRYALERGSRALPPNMPPNRTVMRALNEMLSEPEPEEYRPTLVSEPEPIKLTVELPRYSWSMLGRMLTKACREGSDFQSFPRQHRKPQRSLQFGSPAVELRLSPMLVLPSRVLGRICQYLENSSIWKFEATCRALSVSIMSARATMEKESGTKPSPKEDNKRTSNSKEDKAEDSTTEAAGGSEQGESTEGKVDEGKTEETKTSKKETKWRAPSSRTSNRLRSQLITSGKIAERAWKRKSFDYCFLACTLSTTRDRHRDRMKELKDAGLMQGEDSKRDSLVLRGNARSDPSDSRDVHSREARERIGGSSLSAFVEMWNGHNSGPMDLMTNFLIHVASNVEDVFSSDPSGAVVLTSCLLGCFEILKRRSGFHQGLIHQHFQPVKTAGSVHRSLELFATDLLHAELILRQCDRYSPVHVEFDDDSNQISLIVPTLLDACEDLEESIATLEESKREASIAKRFEKLKVRCCWLTAGFYLWRSRISRMIWEATEAEKEGISYILEAKKCFDSPALKGTRTLFTPHLVSPGRSEPHWKEISRETLTKVRDDLQASSVVSLARQKFLELVVRIAQDQSKDKTEQSEKEKHDTEQNGTNTPEEDQGKSEPMKLSEADASALADIGQILLERYSSPYGDAEAKHAELVDDFLSCHGDEIMAISSKNEVEAKLKLQTMLPLGEIAVSDLVEMNNPSILTMLTTCLQVKAEHRSTSSKLLVHVVMTSIDIHNSLVKRLSDAKAIQQGSGTHGDFSDSDEDSVMSDDASVDRDAANKDADAKRTRQCCHLVAVMIDRLREAFLDHMTNEEQKACLSSKDFVSMINLAVKLSSNWFQTNVRRLALPDDSVDQHIFRAVRNLVTEFCSVADEEVRKKFQVDFFDAMISIFLLQRQYLESLVGLQTQRTGRAARQKQCIKRAEFIRLLGGEIGNVLSRNLSRVEGLKMAASEFLGIALGRSDGNETIRYSSIDSRLRILIDALLSLWKYASQNDSDNAGAIPGQNSCSAFDKPIIRELRVAIATVVIGLCGSITSTRGEIDTTPSHDADDESGDQLCLAEFFDSDASARDFDSEDADESDKDRKELLRAICHAVHCINLVLSKIDDKDALNQIEYSLSLGPGGAGTLGAVLPLVAVRVLNHFADSILMNFEIEEEESEDVKPPDLWADEFPAGTVTTGELLDSNLHKAYRWLYGFALVGEKSHHSSGKDLASSIAPLHELTVQNVVPESTTAAAQLYRCITRAYGSGRRSPPKASLELVSSSLPPLEESEESRCLRGFLFSSSREYFSLEDVARLVITTPGWEDPFQPIQKHLDTKDETEESSQSDVDEATAVRRGISSQLAKGPLPVVTTEFNKQKSDAAPDDERSSTRRNEEEMSKKFFAILDDICLGGRHAHDAEGWYRAAQSLSMKAELIADRMGLSEGYSRNTNFIIPELRSFSNRFVDLDQLEAGQEHEARIREEQWVEHIGNDLSVFIRYSWSSFSSLLTCATEMRKQSLSEVDEAILREIDSLYQSGDYLKWQEVWGGIFISALRKLSLRFMCLALYVLQSKQSSGTEGTVLKSEICETAGIYLYTDLMASQSYGYPMHKMGAKRKRDIATASKKCFQAAADIVAAPSEDDEGSEDRATWDLVFMIGKCDEKIANTYSQESFGPATDGDAVEPRMYEKFMSSALKSYSDAYEQAKSIEDGGGFIVDQSGGSAHGSTELLYRVLASRLKCLISALSSGTEHLKAAEEEALRLTECHWFSKSAESDQKGSHIRDRVWKVLSDVVSGLAQCRTDQHYFHRSVYRHAQALMWAPTLYDPKQSEGSLGEVPATRSFMIRGLNNSTHAANSAEVIMSSLFDKRRSQLVAVWVTTTSTSSPFQVLNNSTRKYDSLRGKYIKAYLECLRLCQRRPQLETFLKWTSVTRRDMPYYFQGSALNAGNAPAKPHTHDNLLQVGRELMSAGFLMTVKRQANSALAYVILKQVEECDQASDKKKTSVNNLKHAYACYLRLHCTKGDLKKRRAWSYGGNTIREVEALCQAYLALDSVQKVEKDFGDWSGGSRKSLILDAALERCRTLFPSTSGSFKKLSMKSKKGEDDFAEDTAPTSKEASGGGDQASPSKKQREMSYEVAVPSNLKEGDTFLTVVKVGDGTRKVKLTVPKGRPSTLRFKLSLGTGSPSPKKKSKKAKADD